MLKILGDTLATGKYRFYGGLDTETEEDILEQDEEPLIDPELLLQDVFAAPSTYTTHPNTP